MLCGRAGFSLGLILLLSCPALFSQNKDSLPKPVHSPKKAAIMSACLPGLGQIYNRKYWKVPLVYAGLGGFGYFAWYTGSQYKTYKTAYIYRTDNDSSTIDDFPEYSDVQLKENVDFYRRYRDLNIILAAGFYVLNIIDASVDAHLFTFDVSDNISFRVQPSFHFAPAGRTVSQFGLSMNF